MAQDIKHGSLLGLHGMPLVGQESEKQPEFFFLVFDGGGRGATLDAVVLKVRPEGLGQALRHP